VPETKAEGDFILQDTAITIAVEYEEPFEPIIRDVFSGADVRIDAIDPADLVGDYPVQSPWPSPHPAPRRTGPDGRAEWGFPVNPPLA
jgi:hypothetical protein